MYVVFLISKICPHNLEITKKLGSSFLVEPNKNTVEETLLSVFFIAMLYLCSSSFREQNSTSFKVCYQASEGCLPLLPT